MRAGVMRCFRANAAAAWESKWRYEQAREHDGKTGWEGRDWTERRGRETSSSLSLPVSSVFGRLPLSPISRHVRARTRLFPALSCRQAAATHAARRAHTAAAAQSTPSGTHRLLHRLSTVPAAACATKTTTLARRVRGSDTALRTAKAAPFVITAMRGMWRKARHPIPRRPRPSALRSGGLRRSFRPRQSPPMAPPAARRGSRNAVQKKRTHEVARRCSGKYPLREGSCRSGQQRLFYEMGRYEAALPGTAQWVL